MIKIIVVVIGVCGYVFDEVVINEDLFKLVDMFDEWIIIWIGIKEWCILCDGVILDIVVKVVEGLFKKINIDLFDVELLIVGMVIFDYFFLLMVNVVCDKLGLKNVWSYDVNVVCLGFFYGLMIGVVFIELGKYKKVIVVGVDKMSVILNYEDCIMCVIFGDGGGVVLFELNYEGYGVVDIIMKFDGVGR